MLDSNLSLFHTRALKRRIRIENFHGRVLCGYVATATHEPCRGWSIIAARPVWASGWIGFGELDRDQS